MQVEGQQYRSIWLSEDGESVRIIDQNRLPHVFEIAELNAVEDAARAIEEMKVRGAPLIGATGAYGMALAMAGDPSDAMLTKAYSTLLETRPTAVNLRWALDRLFGALKAVDPEKRVGLAYRMAAEICDDDVLACEAIGLQGLGVIQSLAQTKSGDPVQILTHCNAGWLATVDWGTALAPIYKAHDLGIEVHVWVDETRPRNQGAHLTAWELSQHGVPHTVVVDNAGGHLMQKGSVDLCLVGTDRTTATGDVCNKIGTYIKALAAYDNGVPFYVAVPQSSIDWNIRDGGDIPIEERDPDEVALIQGVDDSGSTVRVRVMPRESQAANFAFDVTPARLVTGLITERGVCPATEEGLLELYPERRSAEQDGFR